ncbi:MAG: tyrosine-type recombinase/integrase [Burkholderiales bacterium]|nr:tyrosine-type recombinase/integrase [Burkholderiales bacterium]
MEGDLKLPRGIRIKSNNLILDFYYIMRHRVTTTYKAVPDNFSKAEKLLLLIKADLERGQFFIANYQGKIKNANSLLEFDKDYIRQVQCNVGILIQEQLLIYQKRVDAGTLAIATLQGYEYMINLHLIPSFGHLDINEVTPFVIEKFISNLKMSKGRTKTILIPMRIIMKKAKRNGVITENPFDNIDDDVRLTCANKSSYEVKPFSLEEINLILEACNHLSVKNLIQTGFWTGMRIGELFALEWSDINFINEIIKVTKSQTINKQIKKPKTKAGIRDIEITPKAKEALLHQFTLTGNNENQRVFLSPTGKIWSKTDMLGRIWRRVLSSANVEYRNPYQMRHTFISYMLSIGNSPMVLYRMVGHETPEIIYTNYARFINNSGGKLLKTTI